MFLEKLVKTLGRVGGEEELDASDVARFRLLANLLKKSGNEQARVGVHDLNIMFSAERSGMELGRREVAILARLGVGALAEENVPLWRWYSRLGESQIDMALACAYAGASDQEITADIRILTDLRRQIDIDKALVKREEIIGRWLGEKSSVAVKVAALAYLGRVGSMSDYAVVEREFESGDRGTTGASLGCMARILAREADSDAAVRLVVGSQQGTLDEDLVAEITAAFGDIETGVLEEALDHREAKMRLAALRCLRSRGVLGRERLERLSSDRSVEVRYEALEAMMEMGRPLPEDRVKDLLEGDEGARSRGLLAMANPTWKRSRELFEAYRASTLRALSQEELSKVEEDSTLYDNIAYFVRAEKYFSQYGGDLRAEVDSQFAGYFESQVDRLERRLGNSLSVQDLVRGAREIEAATRGVLTRKGLDILCRVNDGQDVGRIRGNLESGFAGRRGADAKYLGRHGASKDIRLLVGRSPSMESTLLLSVDPPPELEEQCARAALRLARSQHVDRLLEVTMPDSLMKKVVELCPNSRFAEISQERLMSLLNHRSKTLRRAVAIRCVLAFPAKRLRELLSEYTEGGEFFYNVVHWLDLGCSMARDEAKMLARASLLRS